MLKKKLGMTAGLAVLVLLCVAGVRLAYRPAQGPSWQEQFDLGLRYLTEGNYEEAIIFFTASIEIDPMQALPYIRRADAHIRSGETAENLTAAMADYQKAVEIEPAQADAYLGMADVFIRRGEYDAAMDILRRGLEAVESGTEGAQAIADKLAEMERGVFEDSDGNERRRYSYDADGNVAWWHDYTYNDAGQQTSVTSYDSGGNETGHMDLLYDADGREIVSYGYVIDNGEIDERFEYTYDEQGNMIREDDFLIGVDFDGNKIDGETYSGYMLFFYDEAGNVIRRERYHTLQIEGGSVYLDEGKLSGYSTMEYDETGKLIRENWFDSHGTQGGYRLYEYDQNGNRSREIGYNMDGTVQDMVIWEYNSQGEETAQKFYTGTELDTIMAI